MKTIKAWKDTFLWHKNVNIALLNSKKKLTRRQRIRPSTNVEARSRTIDDFRKYEDRKASTGELRAHIGLRSTGNEEDDPDLHHKLIESLADPKPSAADQIDAKLIVPAVFRKLMNLANTHDSLREGKERERARLLVCAQFRLYGLEDFLPKEDRDIIEKHCKRFNPKWEYQVARWLGFSVRDNRSSNGYRSWLRWLQWVISDYEEMPEGKIDVPENWMDMMTRREEKE